MCIKKYTKIIFTLRLFATRYISFNGIFHELLEIRWCVNQLSLTFPEKSLLGIKNVSLNFAVWVFLEQNLVALVVCHLVVKLAYKNKRTKSREAERERKPA